MATICRKERPTKKKYHWQVAEYGDHEFTANEQDYDAVKNKDGEGSSGDQIGYRTGELQGCGDSNAREGSHTNGNQAAGHRIRYPSEVMSGKKPWTVPPVRAAKAIEEKKTMNQIGIEDAVLRSGASKQVKTMHSQTKA